MLSDGSGSDFRLFSIFDYQNSQRLSGAEAKGAEELRAVSCGDAVSACILAVLGDPIKAHSQGSTRRQALGCFFC